jgi:hypothetical protein
MPTSNVYLHPALARKPHAVQTLEADTHATAVVSGKVVKLIFTPRSRAAFEQDPRPAA